MGSKVEKRELYEAVQRRLIAALLADSATISRVLELITADDIEEPSLSIIFAQMAELSRLDEKVSHLSVAEKLQGEGSLKTAGGIATLYSLAVEGEKYLLEASPEVYARIIKEASAKAKITRTLKEATGEFTDDSGVPAVEAVTNLQTSLNEKLLSLSDASTMTKFRDDFDNYLALLDDRLRVSEENSVKTEGLQGIPSLLPTLNHYTTGWLPGQMITVGAKTGIGKSIFAVNCAVAAARANSSVMFFSLEMSKTQIEDRILSSSTGISLNKLKQGRLTAEEKVILREEMKEMKRMKLVIDVEPKVTLDMIRARALRQAQSPDGLDFIIVDYLQLITPATRFNSRQEAIADISRNMKLLAKQLGIPIMVLVQLNRKKENGNDEGNALPDLEQIRESGAIGQDSDIVILLHRDKALDDTTPHTLVILAKNRDGEAQKTIRCHSNLESSLFREVTRVKDVERLSEGESNSIADDIAFDFDGKDLDLTDLTDLDDL